MKLWKFKVSVYLGIAIFILHDIAFSFMNTLSTTNQTTKAVFKLSLFIWLICKLRTNDNIIRVIKALFIGYFFSNILVYLINYFMFHNFDDWLNNFNEYHVFRLLFVLSITASTVLVLRWKR